MTKIMADRRLIEEYKLSEAVNRFKQINEYTFITAAPLTEDGEDDNSQNQNPQSQTDNVENAAQAQSMNGNQQTTVGNNSPQQPPMPQQAVDNSTNMMTEPQTDQSDSMMNNNDGVETDIMQPDDEVIDIDDLTDSQEETEEKVDGVSKQLLRLFKVVSKYDDAIDRQNRAIEDLKKEFEKRNPTEEEQLNIRSQAGYPYSEQPKDYWVKKVKENPKYNVMFDNDIPTSKEEEKFEIKDSDLSGLNYREVSDSFDDDDMKLSDFLSL